MKNIYVMATAVGVCCMPSVLTAAPKTPVVSVPKPNIVHVMFDDMGWQDIASHKIDGKPVYETPNLDRFTSEGRRFTQAYSPAPTCAPSRTAFLRGQYPAHTGVYHVMGGRVPRPLRDGISHISPYYIYGLPKAEPIIPEVLKSAGYVSGHVGKWHIGGKAAGYPFPLDQGFDFGFSELNGRQKYYNDIDLWGPQGANKNQFFGMWAQMKPDRLSDFATDDPSDRYQIDEDGRPFDKPLDLAIGFIRKNKEKPFFLNYCTYLVHGPICTRDRARLEHYCKKMGYDFPIDAAAVNAGRDGQTNPYYASMVDSADWMLGKVISYLEATDDPRNPGHKLIDNTYVIVDSDNGGWIGSSAEPMTDNSPLRGGKMQTYEGGLRIPFIVRGPGVAAGTECDTPINLIDLFPTFMDIAGVASDASLDLDGCNILPLIKGTSQHALDQSGAERESIYWFYPIESHMSAAMRRGDWKLVSNYGVFGGGNHGASVDLFRLYNKDGSPNDLSEKVNLADKMPEVRDSMLSEMKDYLSKTKVVEPYRNLAGDATDAERAESPAVLKLGVEKERVWVEFESGAGKVPIVEALLLYTLNPRPFDASRGHREEWFPAPAKINKGRVDAVMPAGATHAAFCMRDANGFLITSEAMPSFSTQNHNFVDSEILKNGYAYKPGLYALIQLGEKARISADKTGLDTAMLKTALLGARQAYESEDDSDIMHSNAIRSLRAAIRNQKGTPEADNPLINRFPTDPRF